MKEPILSVVIANYNYGRFLEAAILSVISQGMGEKIELIVVDGGSSDNSVDVIRKYTGEIAWWVSEKDKGQSNAFNKGFSHANGRYLTWLNADDLMPKGCLCKVCRELETHPDCEWFTGNFFRFTEDGQVIEIGWGPHWYPNFLQRPSSPAVIFGPSTFFSKKIYEEAGKIREDMNFMMDNDLWYRFIMSGIKQRRINCFCWAFRMHERSKTAEFGNHKLSPEQRAKFEEERKACLARTGYHMSPFMHKLCLALRVLDGSLLRRWWLRKTMKHASVMI